MLKFERIPFNDVDWSALDRLPDRTIFQIRPWIEFVARTQHAEPVIAAIWNGAERAGYFSGLMVKKFGIRILGSPFKGWTTAYMGFNLLSPVTHVELLQALKVFAFQELKCSHVELMDRRLTFDGADGSGFETSAFRTYLIDLRRSDVELLSSMNTIARRYIRKAFREGRLVIEAASDGAFAEDYFAQLQDVFAKQRLAPTYGIDRVRALVDCVFPSGKLLLVRARDSTKRCIATGIFPATNDTMYFWGGASLRQFHRLHPNEPIHWFAMQYWKSRGIQRYDMGGGGSYKQKYGGAPTTTPWLRASRYSWIPWFRKLAEKGLRAVQRARGMTGS